MKYLRLLGLKIKEDSVTIFYRGCLHLFRIENFISKITKIICILMCTYITKPKGNQEKYILYNIVKNLNVYNMDKLDLLEPWEQSIAE